ncbi:MAG: hypothetical protein HY074_06150 [Deltaproteobacteria bacterium]|nr:hypothetical protein [Deltaproteobacteria bacterium]
MKRELAWIHSPALDTVLLAFNWLPVVAFCAWVAARDQQPVCDLVGFDSCSPLLLVLFTVTNFVIRIHRHYTYGLVYADSVEFAKRRATYVWFPVLLFLAMLPFAFAGYFPHPWSHNLYVMLVVISVPGGVWNVFHIIMQKYGVLRAYAVRLGYGDARLECNMLLAWSLFLSAALIAKYGDVLIHEVAAWKRIDISFLAPLLPLTRYLFVPTLLPAAYYSWRWLGQERSNFSAASIPKLIYAASIALLLSTFAYSIVIGYIAFGFSHAIEYIAFVNIYGARRPTLAAWMKNRWIMNPVWIVGVVAFYLLLKRLPAHRSESIALVLGYTTYNSYVHFLYDGYIWKMRETSVRETVLRMNR